MDGRATQRENWAISEAEVLARENEGLVVVGAFPTGGSWEETADGAFHLQPTWVGGRISYLLTPAPHTHRPVANFNGLSKETKG